MDRYKNYFADKIVPNLKLYWFSTDDTKLLLTLSHNGDVLQDTDLIEIIAQDSVKLVLTNKSNDIDSHYDSTSNEDELIKETGEWLEELIYNHKSCAKTENVTKKVKYVAEKLNNMSNKANS